MKNKYVQKQNREVQYTTPPYLPPDLPPDKIIEYLNWAHVIEKATSIVALANRCHARVDSQTRTQKWVKEVFKELAWRAKQLVHAQIQFRDNLIPEE